MSHLDPVVLAKTKIKGQIVDEYNLPYKGAIVQRYYINSI